MAGEVLERKANRAPGAEGTALPPVARDGISLDDLQTALDSTVRSQGEPAWLGQLRAQALLAYASLPLPDRVIHLWRYTEPERFLPGAVPVGGPESPAAGWPEELRAASGSGDSGGSLAGAAWVSGGRLRKSTLDPALARAGVIIEDLHRAARERPELVRRHLGALLPGTTGKFEALNAALWRGGLLVLVPRGVEITKPIHVLTTVEGSRMHVARLLIVTEESAAVTVIDEYVGGPTTAGQSGQANVVVEAFVGPAARVRYAAIQRLARSVSLHLAQRGQLDRDARMVSVLASLGGLAAKNDVGTVLAGRGAEVELLGFLFGDGRQHFDHHTVHHHRAPNTRSNLDFKVVLTGRARSAYTGLIRIDPDAPNSEAYQENRNLLLTEGTKADSIPELEILTDEVMCTHGATVGSLDPDHLFYLASRGIPRREARRIIVGGFFEPTLKRLPEDLRERIQAHVEAGLATI